MDNFTIPMTLMDFVPVAFFGVTSVILLRDLYNKMFKCAMLFAAPVVITGSMPFILMMVLGLGGLYAGLSVLAVKMKKEKP